jgi:SM-20-related protein
MGPVSTSTTSDVATLAGFLSVAEAAAIAAEIAAADGTAAPVYGRAGESAGAVTPRVRNVLQAHVAPSTAALVAERLSRVRPFLEQHFDVELGDFETAQFLRYRPGDFFVAHQDGNVPLIPDESQQRRISVVVFLNPQSETPGGFSGGSLILHGHYSRPGEPRDLTAEPGTLVAFRSEWTHEVTAVTSGERMTIVTWFRRR